MESSVMVWMLVAGALAVWLFVLLRKTSINLPPGTVGWPLLGEIIPFFFRLHGFLTKRREISSLRLACRNVKITWLHGNPQWSDIPFDNWFNKGLSLGMGYQFSAKGNYEQVSEDMLMLNLFIGDWIERATQSTILDPLNTLHLVITSRRIADGRYGDLFKTCLLGFPVIISTDPHVNTFILENDGGLFVPQYPTSTMELTGKSNIMTVSGEYHKMKRGGVMRVVGIPILKRRLLSEIQNVITASLSGWGGRNVDIIHEAEEMIFSLMADNLLGLKAGTEFDRMKEDFYVYRKGLFSVPLNIPGTSFHKSLRKKKELSNQIKNIIDARTMNILSHDTPDDLLSLMLKEAVKNEDGELEFATFHIIDFLLALVFSSMEVTPKTIALVMKRLSENPHILKELMEEHEAIKCTKGENEKFSWDDYKSMPYTKCVIKEALRLGDGLLNNMLLRKTAENVQIRGYTIPKGWTCIIFDEFSNLDSTYYTDPLSFNPRRWLDLDMNRTPYITFGAGPRRCPGYDFAMVVMSSFLHHVVKKFQWDYIISDAKSRWFDSPFTSRMNGTFHVTELEK